jgi:hypothetical protein
LPPWPGPLPVAAVAGVGRVRSRKRICIMQHAGQPSGGWAGRRCAQPDTARERLRGPTCGAPIRPLRAPTSTVQDQFTRLPQTALTLALSVTMAESPGTACLRGSPAAHPLGRPHLGSPATGQVCKMWQWEWCRCISVRLRLKMLQKYCYKAKMMDSIIAVFIARC